MVRLLSTLDFRRFSPRLYLVARTDDTSAKRVQHLECSKVSTADSVSIHMNIFTHTLRVCLSSKIWAFLPVPDCCYFQKQRGPSILDQYNYLIHSVNFGVGENCTLLSARSRKLSLARNKLNVTLIMPVSFSLFAGALQWAWNLCSSLSCCFPSQSMFGASYICIVIDIFMSYYLFFRFFGSSAPQSSLSKVFAGWTHYP